MFYPIKSIVLFWVNIPKLINKKRLLKVEMKNKPDKVR